MQRCFVVSPLSWPCSCLCQRLHTRTTTRCVSVSSRDFRQICITLSKKDSLPSWGENYGGTEADPLTAYGIFEPVKPGSLGRSAPDFELAVFDENDKSVGPGIRGEIVARPLARHVMFSGYEGDHEATLMAFRNLWYHTGDMGRYDNEGFFFHEGRLKHAIRRRGENISSQELENIVSSHPDVEACVALGVPSSLGEDDVKIVVTVGSDATLGARSLHEFCRDNMAKFMVPRYIDIRSELPHTKLGKIDRESLRDAGPNQWDAGD